MNTKFPLILTVGLLAGGLLASAAGDAFAKGGRKGGRRTETVRLARPMDGPDEDAGGSITITRTRRGENAVLHAKGLDARTRYEIVDGTTGDVVGTLRTNARGRGQFAFGGARSGKRGARGDSADGAEVPDVVDVVDPDSGDTVLTGDTTGELQYLYGYAMVGNFTESATITMGSDPSIDSQYFGFSYLAPVSDDDWFAGVHDLYLDTAAGDELPLGAASVLDLAGRDFQVRDAAGDVVFRGTLPDVEAYSFDEDPCPKPEEERPFDFENWADLSDEFDYEFLAGMMGGMPSGGHAYKGATHEGAGEPADDVVEFTLWLETDDGFAKAGDLVEPNWWVEPWDDGSDDRWSDEWNWEWDWGWESDGTWTDPSNSTGDGTTRNR